MRIPNICRIAEMTIVMEQFVYHIGVKRENNIMLACVIIKKKFFGSIFHVLLHSQSLCKVRAREEYL